MMTSHQFPDCLRRLHSQTLVKHCELNKSNLLPSLPSQTKLTSLSQVTSPLLEGTHSTCSECCVL